MRVPNVPIATIKLMLFPFSIEGAARIWLEKEPPRSIQTWDDLVSKFINQFFPPSKTTNLRNEITRFQQRFDESFYEAWDRFNDLLCNVHTMDSQNCSNLIHSYCVNINDQDSLNSAAGGNFLDKMPRECLKIIESKVQGSSNDELRQLLQRNKTTKLSAPAHSCTCKAPLHGQRCIGDNISEYVSQALQLIQHLYPKPLLLQGSGTLPVNTVTNPREDLKEVKPSLQFGSDLRDTRANYTHMTSTRLTSVNKLFENTLKKFSGLLISSRVENPTPYYDPFVLLLLLP
ncbi:reverse transcriptase domain-containing protein [Tanacetum coccineum]